MTFAVIFALAAGFSNAVNVLTQHKASISAPTRVKGWRLALYLPRQPLWLLGVAAAVGSFAFQALALHNGPMSVVQPLLVTELIFVLALRRVWIHQDVARAAWASVGVVCVALAVFLAVGEPTGGSAAPEANQWLSAGLVVGGTITVLVLLGMRGSPPPWRRPSSRRRPRRSQPRVSAACSRTGRCMHLSPPPSRVGCSSRPPCTSGH